MARFKVNDRARLKYTRTAHDPKWVPGLEVVIWKVENGISSSSGLPYNYLVEFDGMVKSLYLVLEDQLEPIVDLGSWDELESTIKWNPMKEKVNAV